MLKEVESITDFIINELWEIDSLEGIEVEIILKKSSTALSVVVGKSDLISSKITQGFRVSETLQSAKILPFARIRVNSNKTAATQHKKMNKIPSHCRFCKDKSRFL